MKWASYTMLNPNSRASFLKINSRFHSRFLIFLFLLVTSQSAFAALVPNAAQMLENLTSSVPQLMRLVTAFAYIAGMLFVIKGVIELKHFGESRTMMSEEHSIFKPLTYLFVGAALLYLPTSVSVGVSTFWKSSSPLAYVDESSDAWGRLVGDAFLILQLVGVIAFIRGLIMLTHVAGRHGQPGALGKAVTHMVGGILCINMYQFMQVVGKTLGLNVP